MSDAVAQLHGALGAVAFVLLVALALGAALAVASSRAWPLLERVRQAGLILVVAQVAIGLALAARGARPAEAIHWLYGAAVVLALIAPSSVVVRSDRARGGLLAASTALGAVFAWRLWGSG